MASEVVNGTTPCSFVAILTVTTVFRCCATHGSLFTGLCCNILLHLSRTSSYILQHLMCHCNILSAIATSHLPSCNTPSTIATPCPPLQQPLHHCNATHPPCNTFGLPWSAIATQHIHLQPSGYAFIATLFSCPILPLQCNPSTCIPSLYTLHCNTCTSLHILTCT